MSIYIDRIPVKARYLNYFSIYQTIKKLISRIKLITSTETYVYKIQK